VPDEDLVGEIVGQEDPHARRIKNATNSEQLKPGRPQGVAHDHEYPAQKDMGHDGALFEILRRDELQRDADVGRAPDGRSNRLCLFRRTDVIR